MKVHFLKSGVAMSDLADAAHMPLHTLIVISCFVTEKVVSLDRQLDTVVHYV